jgi:hypothetical protein
MLVACSAARSIRLAHTGSLFRGRKSLTGMPYDVRPHACASIFHSSPCFENV